MSLSPSRAPSVKWSSASASLPGGFCLSFAIILTITGASWCADRLDRRQDGCRVQCAEARLETIEPAPPGRCREARASCAAAGRERMLSGSAREDHMRDSEVARVGERQEREGCA